MKDFDFSYPDLEAILGYAIHDDTLRSGSEEAVIQTLRNWKAEIEERRKIYNQLSELARDNGAMLCRVTWEI